MHIRAFTGIDFDPIARLLGNIWHGRHGEHALWQGADELCDHLAQSDHGFVAEDDDGNVVGAVLLASAREADRNETMRIHWLQQRTRIAAMAVALGVDARADVLWLNEENEFIRTGGQELGTSGVGEIVLLVVQEEARGTGVGTALLKQGMAWLAEHGASTARLVTDDGCNWQFYEPRGFERVMSKPASDDPSWNYYLYQAPLG